MTIETFALIIAFASVVSAAGLVIYVLRRTGTPAAHATGDVGEQSLSAAADQAVLSERLQQLDTRLAAVQAAADRQEGAVNTQMGRIGTDIAEVAALFNNDRKRGNWGELTLERIFEVAGLTKGRDYETQFNAANGRPDAVILLPGDQTMIIDAKFPTARYLEAMAEEDADKRDVALVAHGKELEAVGKSLADKHYADNASAGFVIVYVPSQAVFEAASEAHPEVVERLMERGVIVAGPVTLFALVKTAGTLMAEHRVVKDANDIVGQVRELRTWLGVFAAHMDKVGRGLTTASAAFNKAIGSWNSRLNPTVNKIAEMSPIEDLDVIDEVDEAIGATAPNSLNLKEVS